MSGSEISARKEMCFNRKLYKLAVLCGCEIKVLAAKPCSIKTDKKGVGTRRLKYLFLASSPLVTAPPSNLTRLYCNGSAAKSHSTTTLYRQLRRLITILYWWLY